MNRLFNILTAFAFSTGVAGAFNTTIDSTDLKVKEIAVTVDEQAATARVRLVLDIEKFSLPRDREILFTPILISSSRADSLMLDTITIAGRNRWFSHLRNHRLDNTDALIFRAGQAGSATIDRTLPFLPWMASSSLEMRALSASCCDTPAPLQGESPSGYVPMAKIDTERPALAVDFIFAPPVDAGPVIKNINGSAFVTFVVNRTELRDNYMNNRAELDKIINSIEYVRRDTDATITHVNVKGFASPEGPYDNNVRLAQGRTESLRRYVRDLYAFPDTTVTSSYEPEDWAGLRSYVADSLYLDLNHRAEILDIIDGPLGFDNKNLAIQTQFPEDYALLLREVYPWLRHSDYTVTYAIKVYTSLDELLRVYAADPSRLRNVDFYTIAQSFPVGSDDYCKVFETAVEVYPDDPMLNLNAANIAMSRGQLDQAQSYLLKAGNTPQAHYARGILAARRGDMNEAIKRFEAARAAGLTGIDGIISSAAAIRDHHSVSYSVTPLK